MVRANENYLKLPGSYLFTEIGRKVREYKAQHPEADIISLGIGDVTQPITLSVIKALHKAVDEMGWAKTFRGYAPDLGYEFLRSLITSSSLSAILLPAAIMKRTASAMICTCAGRDSTKIGRLRQR